MRRIQPYKRIAKFKHFDDLKKGQQRVNYSRAKKVMDLLEKIAIEDNFMISIQDTSKLSSLKVKVIQFLMHHIRNYLRIR
jgi:hypothetical protein